MIPLIFIIFFFRGSRIEVTINCPNMICICLMSGWLPNTMCIFLISGWLPSGKHTKNYGKSPCLMGKLTISMAIFNSFLLAYQRVNHDKVTLNQDLEAHTRLQCVDSTTPGTQTRVERSSLAIDQLSMKNQQPPKTDIMMS